MTQVGEHLLCKYETVSSNPSPTKKKKKKKSKIFSQAGKESTLKTSLKVSFFSQKI
jgi:hypothetical protein